MPNGMRGPLGRIKMTAVGRVLFFLLLLATGLRAQNTVIFNGTDTTTQGAWNGVYGADGHILADQEICDGCNPFPAYVTFGPMQLGASSPGSMGSHPTSTHAYTDMVQGAASLMGPEPLNAGNTSFYQCNHTASTASAPLDLQSGVGTDARKSSMWYACGGATFWLDMTFTGAHNFELYAVDSNGARREEIQVVDGDTGTVLYDSGSFSFTNGVWYRWTLTGHIHIKIIDTSASGAWYGALVNGAFFDPATVVSGTPMAPTNVAAAVQ